MSEEEPNKQELKAIQNKIALEELRKKKATTHTFVTDQLRLEWPVTKSQSETLEALRALFPADYFASMTPSDGTVIIGFGNRSVDVDRRGLIHKNTSTGKIPPQRLWKGSP